MESKKKHAVMENEPEISLLIEVECAILLSSKFDRSNECSLCDPSNSSTSW